MTARGQVAYRRGKSPVAMDAGAAITARPVKPGKHGVIRYIRTPKRWTPSDLRLLGRLPDGEIARRTGRFLASVWNKRVQLGIARFAVAR